MNQDIVAHLLIFPSKKNAQPYVLSDALPTVKIFLLQYP